MSLYLQPLTSTSLLAKIDSFSSLQSDDDDDFTTKPKSHARGPAKRTRDESEEYYDHEDEDELAHDDDAILKKHRAGCESGFSVHLSFFLPSLSFVLPAFVFATT